MSKGSFMHFVEGVKTTLVKHSPEILTGIGIAGMTTAAVMVGRATPKALILIEERKEETGVEKLAPVEAVKATWKCYIPAAIVGTTSIFCIIGGTSASLRRNAALATAYAISENALKEYQEKVVEEIGEKKERVIRDAIAKDRIDKDPVTSKEVIITDRGNTLCYDSASGRYFKSDMDKLKKAENTLNRQMRDEMYVSLNEFYYEIGLDGIGVGDDMGWNIDSGYIDLEFSSQLASDGTPCLVISYRVEPRYEYK